MLIIGGGIAGLLCAYFLEQAGVSYVLVEADRICGGITKDTTAKITAQHGLIYDKLIREFGLEKARLYLQANQKALGCTGHCAGQSTVIFRRETLSYTRWTTGKKLRRNWKPCEKSDFRQNLPIHCRCRFRLPEPCVLRDKPSSIR